MVVQRQPLRTELIRAEFRQICGIHLVEQTFSARIYFEFLFPDANVLPGIAGGSEDAPLNPDGTRRGLRFYTESISWMNAIEPPSVLTDKLTPDKDSIRWALEVQGTFLEKFECNDFPFDTQALSVSIEFAMSKEGPFPMDLSIDLADACDVNAKHFVWDSEYDLGTKTKLVTDVRRVLQTRSYPDLTFSCYVRRRPFFYTISTVLPNMLLALLAGLQFFIPVEDVAGRASVSMTLLLVCASYFHYSGSLTPTVGYLTLMDTHALWCMCVVISMVFWVAVVRSSESEDLEYVDKMALYGFMAIWLLIQIVFVLRFSFAWSKASAELDVPAFFGGAEAREKLLTVNSRSRFYRTSVKGYDAL
ncbi:chrna3 [Symbiodinium microadriaticum]|nr:chrna3 [Symbiodinium sp. KB8]CAE7226910.1 chrna3 [Symbiodinium microadriaticum]